MYYRIQNVDVIGWWDVPGPRPQLFPTGRHTDAEESPVWVLELPHFQTGLKLVHLIPTTASITHNTLSPHKVMAVSVLLGHWRYCSQGEEVHPPDHNTSLIHYITIM